MLLIGLGAAWLAGLVPVGLWGAPWWMGAAWTALAGVPAAVRGAVRPGVLAAAVLFAGAAGWRLEGALDGAPPPVAALTGRDAVVTGIVVSEPDPGELATAYDIRIERLELEDGAAVENAGLIRAWMHQYERFLPGDRVRLEGELEAAPVFDGFDYRSYLAARGIGAVMWRPKSALLEPGEWSMDRQLTHLRLALDAALQRSLPEPEASLGAGIAFGRDGGLSRDVKEEFNRSGLRHLVAVSGANLVMVAALTLAVLSRAIGRNRALAAAALAVSGYVILAGFEPSVARAAVMTAVLFAGEAVGRPQSGLPGLALAVILLTAAWPRLALDAGFQLSAAATAGLLTFGPWLRWMVEQARRWWPASWLPGWATEVTALSLAATAATTPITWAHFGAVSVVGPLANVAVQPVVALAFWASLATSAAGLGWRAGGEFAGIVAWLPLRFILDAAATAAAPAWAAVEPGRLAPAAAAGLMAALAAAAGAAYRFLPAPVPVSEAARRRAALGNRLVLGGAAGALAIFLLPGIARPEGRLALDVLDVGQGDALLLTTPGGKQVLIDTGPSGLRLARELGEVMPAWDRKVDLVIISHPQEDHIGGFPALAARFRLGSVVTNGDRNATRTGALTARALGGREVVAQAGDRFEFDGVAFRILWPPEDIPGSELNRRSLAVLAEYGGIRLLFTGDLGAAEQRALLDTLGGGVDILKVPHHGSKNSDAAFLGLAAGGLAVISVGSGNPFGHPHPLTLEALGGATIARTDQDGRIRVEVRDGVIRVTTER
ncbi:ComEC/Rec2 family competence protein [Tepidiforma flava]|uniref:ComEC/Rec2 family competence protein n=1 Tax=Tepidiforma flava TaxID=3004094 RepID=A0ABY7M5Y3_9CHLR|nr:ComEC/Rec2 family competence protein [Tepidiforma flava]WBL35941.1 ComEC/Rec2 family competence protein [Tepidiforma flava]